MFNKFKGYNSFKLFQVSALIFKINKIDIIKTFR